MLLLFNPSPGLPSFIRIFHHPSYRRYMFPQTDFMLGKSSKFYGQSPFQFVSVEHYASRDVSGLAVDLVNFFVHPTFRCKRDGTVSDQQVPQVGVVRMGVGIETVEFVLVDYFWRPVTNNLYGCKMILFRAGTLQEGYTLWVVKNIVRGRRRVANLIDLSNVDFQTIF